MKITAIWLIGVIILSLILTEIEASILTTFLVGMLWGGFVSIIDNKQNK